MAADGQWFVPRLALLLLHEPGAGATVTLRDTSARMRYFRFARHTSDAMRNVYALICNTCAIYRYIFHSVDRSIDVDVAMG